MTQIVLQNPLGSAQERHVRTIDGAARALLRVVNDILDFSKLEADRYKLVIARTSLHDLLRVSIDLLKGSADDKGLELRLELAPDLPDWCLLDGGRLQQVVINLVSNAIKFTDTGWVAVHAVGRHLTPKDFELEIRVEDTGIGVPEDSRATLFDAFTQADNSSSRAHEGTGLGLAISKRLTDLMQGTLDLASRTGSGSVFTLTLPVPRPQPRTQASHRTGDEQPADAIESPTLRKVLVVDDNELNQLVAVELLAYFGFDSDVACGGDEAVRYALEHSYALVLMDCQMPEVDGYEATRRIRQSEPAGRRLPIIACTAHAFDGERAKVLTAGMDDFLAKPIETEALLSMLDKWLGQVEPPSSSHDRPLAVEGTPKSSIAVREHSQVALEVRARSAQFVMLFLASVPEQIAQLQAAAGGGLTPEFGRLAHKLKGSALSCGAARMAALCATLEKAEQLSHDEVERHLAHLTSAYEEVQRLLTLERETLGPGAPQPAAK